MAAVEAKAFLFAVSLAAGLLFCALGSVVPAAPRTTVAPTRPSMSCILTNTQIMQFLLMLLPPADPACPPPPAPTSLPPQCRLEVAGGADASDLLAMYSQEASDQLLAEFDRLTGHLRQQEEEADAALGSGA